MARSRRRRRWAVEGLTVLACVVALVSYLAVELEPAPDEAATVGVPASTRTGGRPSGVLPTTAGVGAVIPSPGLNPRLRTPTPPPTPSPTPPRPVSPLLTVSQADMPATVDLSAAGVRDWVHWGLGGGNSVNRKRGGSGEIVDQGGRGDRLPHDSFPEYVSWRDGAPVETATETPTGVYTCGVGSGFALAVAGSGELRTVRLYAGLWMARGRLDVRLSTGGPTTTLHMEDPHTTMSAEFTVRFRAERGAKLLINWTTEAVFDDTCGNVDVQAVTLR